MIVGLIAPISLGAFSWSAHSRPGLSGCGLDVKDCPYMPL